MDFPNPISNLMISPYFMYISSLRKSFKLGLIGTKGLHPSMGREGGPGGSLFFRTQRYRSQMDIKVTMQW